MVALAKALHALIVDDDRGVRESVGSILRAEGHRPFPAACRQEAVDVARRHPIHFSIVDVHVQAEDGLLIVDELRREVGTLPLIVISGDLTPEIIARARARGARRCLDKPLDLLDLRRAVRELIDLERL